MSIAAIAAIICGSFIIATGIAAIVWNELLKRADRRADARARAALEMFNLFRDEADRSYAKSVADMKQEHDEWVQKNIRDKIQRY